MPTQKRPKDEAPATVLAPDDTFLIDGATNGVRALPGSYLAANFAPIANLDREIRADAPIAYWPMTNPVEDGAFDDPIYGGRDITPTGVTFYQASALGAGVQPAAFFPTTTAASSASAAVDMAFLQGAYTVEFVFSLRNTVTAAFLPLFLGYQPGTTSPEANYGLFAIGVGSATQRLQIFSGDNLASFSTVGPALTVGEVYHVALARSAAGLGRVFINGLRDIPDRPVLAPTPTAGSAAKVWVCTAATDYAAAHPTFYMGYLAFYDKALTPARVISHAINLARA